MKKILTLVLVLGLVLGLAAPAWATFAEIIIDQNLNQEVGPNAPITISGTMPVNSGAGTLEDPEYKYTNPQHTVSGIPAINPGADGKFSVTFNATDLPPGSVKAVTFSIKEEKWISGILADDGIISKTVNFTILTTPTVTYSHITLTCTNCSNTASVNSGDQALLPPFCVYNRHRFNIGTSLGTTFDITYPLGPTIDAAPASTSTRSVKAANKTDPGLFTNYTFTASPSLGNSGNLTALSVAGGGTTASASTFPTTPQTAVTLSVASSATSFTISSTTSNPTNADVKVYNAHSGGTIITGSQTQTLGASPVDIRVEVISPDGSNKNTYYYKVARSAAAVDFATAVNISTSSTSTSPLVVNYTTKITSGTDTHTITIPSNYATTTKFYAHFTMSGSTTITSATFPSNTTATVTSGKIVTLDLPTATTSQNLVLTFSTGHTKTITITRATSSNTLASGIDIRTANTSSGGSRVVNYTTNITTTSSTPTIKIPSNYSDTSTFYAHVTMPSGVTLSSATFGGSSANVSGGTVVTLSLPTSTDSRNLVLRFNSGGTNYDKTITIEREANVVRSASLNSLYVTKSSTSTSSSDRYTLNPSFEYAKTKYDVDLARTISEVYLHFSTYQSSATYSVNGATRVSDGVYKASLTADRTREVTITVSYKTGSSSSSTETTKYTINLNSGGSSKAKLSNLRVADRNNPSNSNYYTLLPSFSSFITEYTVLVPYDGSSRDVYVQGTLNDRNDTLTIDGSTATSGNWVSVGSISAGKTKSIRVRVNDNDSNSTTYNLNIIAAPNSADNNANLSSLSLRSGSSGSSAINISPSFSASTTSYTADSVANDVDTVRVYAEGRYESAIVVNDVLVDGGYATINLAEGNNSIKVTVYAEDCKANKTYTITINRAAAGSSDSTLLGLEVRVGTASNQTLNLIPGFAKNILNYRVNVDESTTQVSFRPTATDNGAVIRLLGSTVTSGQWTGNNAISSGVNTFLFSVTSADGRSTTSYTLEVQRGLSVVVSTWGLRVNGRDVVCAAYNINGNNYFKLRDIAYALRGTPKQFNVSYNNATRVVSMISGQEYLPAGGEMIKPDTPKKYVLSNQTMMVDNRNVNLTAYNVDGNNYFMLREIGNLFNFGITPNDITRIVDINTSANYVPE